jgi:hypothetical protein
MHAMLGDASLLNAVGANNPALQCGVSSVGGMGHKLLLELGDTLA